MKDLLYFIEKRYLTISGGLILIGILIDLCFLDAIPIKNSETIKDLTGNTVTFDYYVFTHKYEALKIVSSLCYGLGISILVLLALELKYDKLEKEKQKEIENKERENFERKVEGLQEKINQNIFDGVLKKLIPETLFELIVKDLLNQNILRENAHWIYDILEGQSNNYIVEQTITYNLRNISRKQITETLTVATSETARCKTYFNYFKVERNGTIIVEKNQKQIEDEIVTDASTKTKKYPVTLEPDEVIKVMLNIKNEYIDKKVFGCHNSNYSIVGLNIEVNKPENCDVEIFPSFTSKLNATRPSERKIIYDKVPGILIGQGLSYKVEPK